MGTITGQSIADNAAGLLHDVAKTRWTDADYLTWLNDAQRQAVLLDPSIFTVHESFALTADKTEQTLPTGANTLMSVSYNLGADGLTIGRAVRVVAKDALDAQVPTWHTDPADAVNGITDYMYDPRDRDHFYVYPKAPATAWYVELVYGGTPTALTALADPITIKDLYANALLDYLMYRAYMRDNVYGEIHPAAMNHFQLFVTQLGSRAAQALMNSPNLVTPAAQPTPAASATKPI